MVNVETDPDIHVEKKQGSVKFQDGGEGVLLGRGDGLGGKPGRVIVSNKGKRYLTFNSYEEIPGGRKEIGKHKVDPGKNVSIHAFGDTPQEALQHPYDIFLGSFVWNDADPRPADPGGQTPKEREINNAIDWIKKNMWWVLLLIGLGVTTSVIVWYVYFRKKKAPETPPVVVAPAPIPPPAPVVVVSPEVK